MKNLMLTYFLGGLAYVVCAVPHSFEPAEFTVSLPENSGAKTFVDLNNDGRKDLVYTRENDLFWNLNLDGRQFQGADPIVQNMVVGEQTYKVSDVNGDGKMDIIAFTIIGNNTEFCILENKAPENANNFQFRNIHIKTFENLHRINAIEAADVDGDRDKDILTIEQFYPQFVPGNPGDLFTEVILYENKNGIFYPKTLISEKTETLDVSSILLRDLDQDRLADILITRFSTQQLVWLKNMGAGYFAPEKVIENGLRMKNVLCVDVDNDRIPDLLSTNSSKQSLLWFKGLGNGFFEKRKMLVEGGGDMEYVQMEDLNADGYNDLVYSSEENCISVAMGKGKAVFNPSFCLFEAADPLFNIVDFEGDGDKDIFAVDYGTRSSLNLLRNTAKMPKEEMPKEETQPVQESKPKPQPSTPSKPKPSSSYDSELPAPPPPKKPTVTQSPEPEFENSDFSFPSSSANSNSISTLKSRMQQKTTSVEKLKLANDFVSKNKVSTADVAQIFEALKFETDKLSFAKYAFHYVSDKENYHKILSLFQNSDNKDSLLEFLFLNLK